MKKVIRYFCGECDDWKPRAICPDCGTPCATYVKRADNVIVGARRRALSEGEG